VLNKTIGRDVSEDQVHSTKNRERRRVVPEYIVATITTLGEAASNLETRPDRPTNGHNNISVKLIKGFC
jgi:hypothetical protein